MTQQTQPSAPAASDTLDRGVFLVAGVVVLGAIMSILDTTIVNVALPTFQSEFDASYARIAWVMTGYTLALAIVVLTAGALVGVWPAVIVVTAATTLVFVEAMGLLFALPYALFAIEALRLPAE